MELAAILADAIKQEASDILLVSGLPVTCKSKGRLVRQQGDTLYPGSISALIEEMYRHSKRSMTVLEETGEDDFSFAIPELSRFRVNTLRQRGSYAAVIRVVSFALPDYKQMMIPENVMSFAKCTKGLVLVSGPAGSGKTTTLACIIKAINDSRNDHIITIEDPIEFLHRHNKSVVTQRELSIDTQSYDAALRAALRQAPDVILLGEMRDYETIKAVVTAAETGHMIISTLHTVGASNTIERIIDTFPSGQQHQIRMQLSMVLQGIVSQQLVPTLDGGMVPAFEVMVANPAVSNMIREAKGHQIESIIYSSASEGMITMDSSLYNLVQQGKVSAREALAHGINREQLQKRLSMAGLMN